MGKKREVADRARSGRLRSIPVAAVNLAPMVEENEGDGHGHQGDRADEQEKVHEKIRWEYWPISPPGGAGWNGA